MVKSRKFRKIFCFLLATSLTVFLFFEIKTNKKFVHIEAVDSCAQEAKEILMIGKTSEKNTYIIKADNSLKISDEKFLFKNVSCSVLKNFKIDIISKTAVLLSDKNQIMLEGDVVIMSMDGILRTNSACFDYRNEKIFGNEKTLVKWLYMNYKTDLESYGFEYSKKVLKLKKGVKLKSIYVGVL